MAQGSGSHDNLADEGVSSYKQMRREAALGVHRALERGRKTLWELVARRVTSFLSCDAFSTVSSHHFLQCLDWTNNFILAGEAFCGSEAISLRAKLVKLSEKYFVTFHRQNLEVCVFFARGCSFGGISSGFMNLYDAY